MIGCPSDIEQEINLVREVVYEWNSQNSEKEKVVLLPIHWSTDSYSLLGVPQHVLNRQLVAKSDCMVAIFGCRLGTPTSNYESGTLEEISLHNQAHKPVMVFFKKNISTDGLSTGELCRLFKYKEELSQKALYKEYDSVESFKVVFSDQLTRFINAILLSTEQQTVSAERNPNSQSHQQLFIDMWKSEVGEDGGYDEGSGYYYLNGITDLTYEEALAIFNAGRPNNEMVAEAFYMHKKIRTNLPWLNPIKSGCGRLFMDNETIEKVVFKQPVIIDQDDAFMNCPNLHTIEGEVIINSPHVFGNCPKLENMTVTLSKEQRCRNIDLSGLPKISYESLKYMIDNA